MNQSLREQQDAAYLASLQQDQEKERKRREEREAVERELEEQREKALQEERRLEVKNAMSTAVQKSNHLRNVAGA